MPDAFLMCVASASERVLAEPFWKALRSPERSSCYKQSPTHCQSCFSLSLVTKLSTTTTLIEPSQYDAIQAHHTGVNRVYTMPAVSVQRTSQSLNGVQSACQRSLTEARHVLDATGARRRRSACAIPGYTRLRPEPRGATRQGVGIWQTRLLYGRTRTWSALTVVDWTLNPKSSTHSTHSTHYNTL